MLYEFKNYNKHGNVRTRIVPGSKGKAFSVNPKGLGNYIGVRVFKYEYKHELMPPSLLSIGGKKYIVPTWQEINPLATLEDIKWVPKKTEPKPVGVVNTW